MPKFFFLVAGEKVSEMFQGYHLKDGISPVEDYEVLFTDFEDFMDYSKSGHDNFEDCETEAKVAIREAEAPFAVVFRGSKIYAYVAHDKTSTFEVI